LCETYTKPEQSPYRVGCMKKNQIRGFECHSFTRENLTSVATVAEKFRAADGEAQRFTHEITVISPMPKGEVK